MTAQNKWNGKDYLLIEKTDKTVTLKRKEDGYTFTIAKSEYFFSYFEKVVDRLN